MRNILGAAAVDDEVLATMVAAQLGVGAVGAVSVTAEVAPYDLDALTTAGRYWVHGSATTSEGTELPYRFFVKVVQSWERSPVFQMVPEAMRAEALAMIPWEREPAVYRSDLGDRLPQGLTMPAARLVADVDELSAAVWLDAVDVQPVRWDVPRFERAAHLLGRLAASPRVSPLGAIGETPQLHRRYAAGRVAGQVLPALHDDDLWRHPLMAAGFDTSVRDRLRDAATRLPAFLDELDTSPLGTSHGDACPRNLLVRRGCQDGGSFVLIDFGFWGRAPLGFDLSQLLLGEVQTGERPASDLPDLEAAIVPAYVAGLAAEGTDVDPAVVQRTHVLLALLFNGLSAVPFELLGGPPDEEAVRVTRERCAMAEFLLDLEAAS
ncbi:MAG TPA: phosphotransferase [Actinomycetes bacterium]|nr:phosphotransferase [Actinomycetes bacterium]